MVAFVITIFGVVAGIIGVVNIEVDDKRLAVLGCALFRLIRISLIKLVVWIAAIVPVISTIAVVDAPVILIPILVVIQGIIYVSFGVVVDRVDVSVIISACIVVVTVTIFKVCPTLAKDEMQVSMSMVFPNGRIPW